MSIIVDKLIPNILTLPSHLITGDEVFKILFSALVGCMLGFEREIRRKPAGFRTLALICLGATIFTICSYLLGTDANRDRLAANIITGVGFLGAGVIFRNGASVSGITTATTIWIAAALGTLIGIGEYLLSLLGLLVSLVILYALDFFQIWLDKRFQHRYYTINYKNSVTADSIKSKLTSLNLKHFNFKELRQNDQTVLEFDITGKQLNMELFNQWVKNDENIYSFNW